MADCDMVKWLVRLFLGLAALLVMMTWPAVAHADTCLERANKIMSGQMPRSAESLKDPDCQRGSVVGAGLSWAAASVTALAAVTLGLAATGAGAVAGASATGAAVASAGAASTESIEVGPVSAPGPPPGVSGDYHPPKIEPTGIAGLALAGTLTGQPAFALLKRADLVEPVPERPGVYRPLPKFNELGLGGEQSSGISGIAYTLQPDGTLAQEIAVGLPDGHSAAELVTTSAETASGTDVTSMQGQLERLNLPTTELRQAVIELLNPAKLAGGRFEDIERFREAYWDAKKIEDPIKAVLTQQLVVEAFAKEFGFSPSASFALLEMSETKWNALATLIASLG